jgi:hypothetical protein
MKRRLFFFTIVLIVYLFGFFAAKLFINELLWFDFGDHEKEQVRLHETREMIYLFHFRSLSYYKRLSLVALFLLSIFRFHLEVLFLARRVVQFVL